MTKAWYHRGTVSVLNPLAREISAKIVYYGPGLSGKTTSLHAVYAAVRPERRGELVSLATETDRTIFFDFLPLHIERVQGMTVRFQLYTVPGQVFYGATRKLVLTGADGVVFVADSQPECRDSNLESLESLRVNLTELGVELEDFPLVFQYNKRDLPNAVPQRDMSALLNFLGAPEYGSCATTGEGVLPVLKDISKLVIKSLTLQQPAVRRRIVDGDSREPREPEGGIVHSVYTISQVMAEQGEISNALLQMTAEPSSRRTSPIPQAPEPRTNGVTVPVVAAPSSRMTFARLWPEERAAAVQDIEMSIANGDYAAAVRATTVLLAELLESLPGPSGGADPGTKAALLGVDGREYLRVCRLATMPPEVLVETDALLALHVLVSARLKASMV
jgi:signal recognition particle receptor subunit beta